MATLNPVPVPGFEQSEGESERQHMIRVSEKLRELSFVAMRLEGEDVVNAVIHFRTEDGNASYIVSSDSPLTIQKIEFPGSTSLSPEEVEAVTLDVVKEKLAHLKEHLEVDLEQEAFYETLSFGQTVHYHVGGNAFVRCVVDEYLAKKFLLPKDLIGPWPQGMLWERSKSGAVEFGYHVISIREGVHRRPHHSLIWEGTLDKAQYADPTGLPPVGYEPPSMSDLEQTVADKWAIVARIRDVVAVDPNNPREDVDTILMLVQACLP